MSESLPPQKLSRYFIPAVVILILAGSLFVNIVFIHSLYILKNGIESEVVVESKNHVYSSGSRGGLTRWPVIRITFPAEDRYRFTRSIEINVEDSTWKQIQPGQKVWILKDPEADEAILRDHSIPGTSRLLWTIGVLTAMAAFMIFYIKNTPPNEI